MRLWVFLYGTYDSEGEEGFQGNAWGNRKYVVALQEVKKVFLIKRHPMGGTFLAICLFGFVFTVRPLTATEYNHERIHAAQQRELLYLPFFVWYVLEWLVLVVKYRDRMKAYYHIRFEREAYNHQEDMEYLKHRRHFHYR